VAVPWQKTSVFAGSFRVFFGAARGSENREVCNRGPGIARGFRKVPARHSGQSNGDDARGQPNARAASWTPAKRRCPTLNRAPRIREIQLALPSKLVSKPCRNRRLRSIQINS